jgi:hypothetical protein
MYPTKMWSNFELALKMWFMEGNYSPYSILDLNWAKREIEKQYRKIWREFKAQLEVF